MFSALPDSNLTIAAGKQYIFTFSSWSSAETIKKKAGQLVPYADNILVSSKGMTQISISLVPKENMPFYAWQSIFKGIGLDDMEEAYAGKEVNIPAFSPVNNISTYWEPKISAVTKGIGAAFDWTKTVTIAGAVIVGGILILRILPKRKD